MTIDLKALSRDELEAELRRLSLIANGCARSGPVNADGELARALERARIAEDHLALSLEAADAIGWWDWDIPADRCRSSAGFARFFGIDPADAEAGLPRAAYSGAVHPEDRARVAADIASALEAGGTFSHEFRMVDRDGTTIWIYGHGRCDHDAGGNAVRCTGVALNVSLRKASDARKSALVELGDLLRDVEDVGRIAYIAAEVMARALGATRAGFGVVDPVQETVMMQPDWRAPGVESLAGLHRFRDYGSFIDDLKKGEPVIILDVTTDPRTAEMAQALAAIGIRVLVNLPILEHGRFVFVVFVHHDRPHAWSGQEITFVRNVADRTQSAIARLRAEEQRRLLHREIGHRLKNNQAIVQAIVTQTLRNAPDLETARATLTERLHALGRAHEVLFSGEMENAEVEAVIDGALKLHDDGQGRIAKQGPQVRMNASVALSLALILHELATNAAKYGALSVPDGKVRVAWDMRTTPEAETLFTLLWSEDGGPTVSPPTRKGFGTRLIERGLAGGAGSLVRLDYDAGGVVCELVATLSDIAPCP